MIRYSPRAAKAIGFLKQAYNDIEVYVEDTANQNLWLKLLRQILPANIKLSSITMLGGREKVLAACALDQKVDKRKRIYIIDGDFDFIRGKSKPRLKNLYRLRAYCVENLLLNERALTEIACDSAGNVNISRASELLSFDRVVRDHEDALKALFTVYAVAQDLQSGIKTVGANVKNLMDSQPTIIAFSDEKIIIRARKILRQLCKRYGTARVRAKRKIFFDRARSLSIDMTVSGKDYLLPPLHLHLRRSCNYLGTEDQLKIHLAKEYNPTVEPYLARAIRQAAA